VNKSDNKNNALAPECILALAQILATGTIPAFKHNSYVLLIMEYNFFG
jgi:hypothetical protein